MKDLILKGAKGAVCADKKVGKSPKTITNSSPNIKRANAYRSFQKRNAHKKKTFFLLIYRFKLVFDLDRWQPAIKLSLGGKGGKGGGDAREPIKRNLPPA